MLDSSERPLSRARILGLLFFLAFVSATRLNQHTIVLPAITRRLLPCGDGWGSYRRRANRNSRLAKSGRSIDPSLASRFGEAGISPLYLFLGALVPTLIDGAAFMLLS
jgi:hypothetical protein